MTADTTSGSSTGGKLTFYRPKLDFGATKTQIREMILQNALVIDSSSKVKWTLHCKQLLNPGAEQDVKEEDEIEFNFGTADDEILSQDSSCDGSSTASLPQAVPPPAVGLIKIEVKIGAYAMANMVCNGQTLYGLADELANSADSVDPRYRYRVEKSCVGRFSKSLDFKGVNSQLLLSISNSTHGTFRKLCKSAKGNGLQMATSMLEKEGGSSSLADELMAGLINLIGYNPAAAKDLPAALAEFGERLVVVENLLAEDDIDYEKLFNLMLMGQLKAGLLTVRKDNPRCIAVHTRVQADLNSMSRQELLSHDINEFVAKLRKYWGSAKLVKDAEAAVGAEPAGAVKEKSQMTEVVNSVVQKLVKERMLSIAPEGSATDGGGGRGRRKRRPKKKQMTEEQFQAYKARTRCNWCQKKGHWEHECGDKKAGKPKAEKASNGGGEKAAAVVPSVAAAAPSASVNEEDVKKYLAGLSDKQFGELAEELEWKVDHGSDKDE